MITIEPFKLTLKTNIKSQNTDKRNVTSILQFLITFSLIVCNEYFVQFYCSHINFNFKIQRMVSLTLHSDCDVRETNTTIGDISAGV